MRKRRYSSAANSVSGATRSGRHSFVLAPALKPIGSAPLSRFRKVTHQPATRYFEHIPLAQFRTRSSIMGSQIVNKLLPRLDMICKDRRERRRVLFSIGKNGAIIKPRVFTLKSLVRC